MNNERSVLTRRDVAHELLRATGLEILRTQVRRKREWAVIYRGFRPQLLTRSIFLRGTSQFSNNVPLLYDLCTVFLDSVNAPADRNIRVRFRHIPDDEFGNFHEPPKVVNSLSGSLAGMARRRRSSAL